jgi:hypothetical protein
MPKYPPGQLGGGLDLPAPNGRLLPDDAHQYGRPVPVSPFATVGSNSLRPTKSCFT